METPIMQPEFWRQRWASNQIAFHESQANPLLVAHFDALGLSHGSRVFVPLCGKTLDIDWLLSRGYQVAGAELSTLAVAQLFERLEITPAVARVGALERHSASGLDIFLGDIFDLSVEILGRVDAIYDRAALVALPLELRQRYVKLLDTLAGNAPQLLITLAYDQTLVDGPPFSVTAAEVREHHPQQEPKLLASHFQPTGLKDRYPVTESVWAIR
jgi:thiopurine S-methyltransferase